MTILDTMLEKLPGMYNKNNDSIVYKLIQLVADQFEAGENSIKLIKDWRDIDQAQGAALDRIGKDVGQMRGGMDDGSYRKRIKIKIRANLSEGDIETLNDICMVLIGERYQGIDEGWTLPVDDPIGPKPAMMLFTVKADDITFGIPIAEIDDIRGGGIASNWQLLIDRNVKLTAEYQTSSEASAVYSTKPGIDPEYQTYSQTYLNAGEAVLNVNLMNTKGV